MGTEKSVSSRQEGSSTKAELAIIPVSIRKRLRDWWSAALAGQTQVSMPDLAKQAEQFFADDPGFITKFWEEFGYEVLYDAGINILSERRYMHGDDGGAVEGLEQWFERTSGGHVALSSASDEEWDAALERREADIEIARARVQALRDARAGLAVVGVRGIAYDPRHHDVPPAIEVVGIDESGELQSLHGANVCSQCQSPSLDARAEWDTWCPDCVARYGTHLLKATVDYFDYAMRLTSGDLIYFNLARIQGEWIYVGGDDFQNATWHDGPPRATQNPPFDRGLQIHLSAIAWCADAPFGS